MSHSLLFVHSPLVGPSSMQRLADSGAGDGYAVSLPDLTAAAEAATPLWRAFVERAVNGAASLPSDVVVIGHSGAGAFLPKIGEALGERLAGLVFVDAVVPPELGFHTTPGDMIDSLEVEDPEGLLLPWLEWWPPEDVVDLLPDADDRRLLAADMPRLPRSFYDEAIPVSEGWSGWPCAYLQLSDAYDAEYKIAGERGWPRRSIDGAHLSTHTEPAVVFESIRSLVERSI